MAGHSRWAKVKHFKGGIDAKRAKIFAKLGREITVAAKLSGGDPDMNPRLRMILLKCRAANMPADNIERAIKKGVGGGESTNFEDLTYEIYGPHGVALLVEVSTDNRNRTASDARSLATKMAAPSPRPAPSPACSSAKAKSLFPGKMPARTNSWNWRSRPERRISKATL